MLIILTHMQSVLKLISEHPALFLTPKEKYPGIDPEMLERLQKVCRSIQPPHPFEGQKGIRVSEQFLSEGCIIRLPTNL